MYKSKKRVSPLYQSEIKRQVKAQLLMCKEDYINKDGKVVVSKFWERIRNLVGCYGDEWKKSFYNIDIKMITPAVYSACDELSLEIE